MSSDGAYVDADAPGVSSVDLVALMDAFLKKHKRRLRDVWTRTTRGSETCCRTRNWRGSSTRSSGQHAVSRAQRKYLEVVLSDVQWAGASYEGLVKAMQECKDRKRRKPHPLVAPGLSETPEVLDRLKSYMFNNMISAKRIFASFDVEECGWLEIEQLRQMVHKIAPDVSESEKRRLTAGLAWMDPRGEAKVRYIDLIRCAKIAKLKVEPMSWGEVSTTPPAKEFVERADRKAEKKLEEKINGPAPTRPRPTAAKTPARGPAKTPAAAEATGCARRNRQIAQISGQGEDTGETGGRYAEDACFDRRAAHLDRVRGRETRDARDVPARSRFRAEDGQAPGAVAARAQATVAPNGVETGLAAVVQEIIPSHGEEVCTGDTELLTSTR